MQVSTGLKMIHLELCSSYNVHKNSMIHFEDVVHVAFSIYFNKFLQMETHLNYVEIANILIPFILNV